jgi:RNA polymerase sigma factor (sigma-70 family)
VPGTLWRVNDQSDQQLLCAYAERQSEAAFAVLVQRYVDLVHSAAFRMVCDAHAARDVTQSVFVVLAQNARQLTDRPALAGWLHNTARNLAVKAIRSDVRRRAREQEAAVMNELLSANPDTSWEHIAPYLDDALGELSEPDRDAVLLRYFNNQDLRAVGATLGISDDAAQKRVSRAVERLREFFVKRGVTVGASGLAVVISANAVQAAPMGLALTISTAAALTGTTLATTATVTATKAIAMTAIQKTIVSATIAVLAGAGIYEARQASQLREQVQTLQQKQAPLIGQVAQIASERDNLARQIASLREDNDRVKQTTAELVRLRGEVARLRSDAQAMAQLKSAEAKATDDPFVKTALKWKANETKLRQLLQQIPSQQIPELKLLDEGTYLDVAKESDLDTDAGIRKALSRLRFIAENELASRMHLALQKFSEDNGGQPPQTISQLASYFDPRIADAVFERYEFMKTGTNVAGGWRGGWVVTQKEAVDAEYDKRWLISPVGYGTADFKAADQ